MIDPGQQDTLLELLNTTPVTNGTPTDELADREAAKAWQKAHGGSGSTRELAHLVQARDALQEVVRGARPTTSLAPILEGVRSRPHLSPTA